MRVLHKQFLVGSPRDVSSKRDNPRAPQYQPNCSALNTEPCQGRQCSHCPGCEGHLPGLDHSDSPVLGPPLSVAPSATDLRRLCFRTLRFMVLWQFHFHQTQHCYATKETTSVASRGPRGASRKPSHSRAWDTVVSVHSGGNMGIQMGYGWEMLLGCLCLAVCAR